MTNLHFKVIGKGLDYPVEPDNDKKELTLSEFLARVKIL